MQSLSNLSDISGNMLFYLAGGCDGGSPCDRGCRIAAEKGKAFRKGIEKRTVIGRLSKAGAQISWIRLDFLDIIFAEC